MSTPCAIKVPLSVFTIENNLDAFLITETNIKLRDTKSFLQELTPPRFKFFSKPRSKAKFSNKQNQIKGGGVGCFFRGEANSTVIEGPTVPI